VWVVGGRDGCTRTVPLARHTARRAKRLHVPGAWSAWFIHILFAASSVCHDYVYTNGISTRQGHSNTSHKCPERSDSCFTFVGQRQTSQCWDETPQTLAHHLPFKVAHSSHSTVAHVGALYRCGASFCQEDSAVKPPWALRGDGQTRASILARWPSFMPW
jgi:hypothetical protein